MAAVELKLSLAPELDVPKLNAMINALKQSLGPLGKEIKPIDAAALNSELKKIESEAAKAAAEFDKVAQSTEKVKNSAAGFDKVFKFNQITQGVTTIANSFQAVLSVGNEFEATLAAVGAVTGQSGEGLTKLGDGARELAKQFGTSASENLKSFQGILSKFGPQVADNAAALKSMGDTVNTLSAASGDAADVSMAALTDTMLQLGLVSGDAAKDADTMRQVADALAASAKVGAAEIPQVAQSILQAGVAAKGANLSLEQTTAAIQVLAVGGKTGSEAGVALRNVLGLLQKQSGPGAAALKNMGTSVEELASVLTTQGLEAALTKLKAGLDTTGSTAERNAALMTLFGTENSAAAGILLDNLGQFGAFTEGISDAVAAGTSGADGAAAQASARLGTAEAIAGRLKAQIEDVFIGIQGTLGSGVAGILAATAQVAPTLSSITQIKNLLPEDAVGQVKEYATQLLAKFIPSVFATNAAVATSGATAATSATAFSTMWAAITGPVALVVGAIALVVGGLYLMYQNVESFRDKVDGIFDFFAELWTVVQPVLSDIGGAIADVGALVFDLMITPFEFLGTIIGEAAGAIFGLIGAGAEGAGTMETLKSVIGGISDVVTIVKAAIAGITDAFSAVKDGIKDSIGKLAEGDLIGAAKSFIGIGSAAGEAFNDGAAESLRADTLKKSIETMNQELADTLTVQAKFDTVDALPQFAAQLKELQASAQAIEVKVQAGTATEEDIKKLDTLKARAEATSAKIAEIAPNAVTSQRTVIDAAGNLKKVYDVNIDSVGKLAEEQKKAFGADLKKNADDYSNSLLKTVGVYEEQKKQLAEVKAQAEAAAAAGDTKKAEELATKYKELKGEVEKTGAQIETSFIEGGKAGLVTQKAIEAVAKAQGITAEQAKQRLIAKSLEDAAKAGKTTDKDIAKIAERFGITVAEAKKLLEQQKAQTAEAKNTAASVAEITKSYNEAFNATKQARDEGISQQIALQAAISKLAKDDPERKRLLGELAAIKQKNRENDKLYDIEVKRQKEVNAQYEEKEKKEKSLFQTIKSTYETEAERLENAQKRFEIDVESIAIAEGRKKNAIDELNIAEKEVETIKGKIDAARQLGSIDDQGNVTVSAKLTGSDADDAKKLLDDLYLNLLQARNKVGDVKLKASIEEIELRAQIRQEELDALREQVEAGILPSAALIDELGKEINKINEEILVADAKTKVKLKKQADSYDGEIRKLQKKEYDEAVRLIDEKAKAESDARKEQLSAVKAQTEAIIAASRTASELTASDTRDSALADLERQREEELISEAEFKAKKEELESSYQNRMTTIRSQDAGQRLALQLDTDTKELEARRATLEEKLRLAKASGETESAKKLQDELTELDKTVKEKGTQLTAAVDVLKAGINESITGLFQGDEDAMKNSMRSTLATLAGFLERIAAAAVLEIVLTSAPIKALASAAGPLAPLVLGGISALINSGVNALLQPILSKVLSFSTGGVFTSPTLAMVGDASRLGGPNIEYLLRNDQMNALMREVLDRHDNKVVGAIAVLSEEIRSMSTRLVIRGSDLHAAVTRRDDAISARARPLPA